MPTIPVDTKHPVDVTILGSSPLTIRNISKNPVYYKQGILGATVSSTVNDGEITEGKSFRVTQATWVIAKEPGVVLEWRAEEGEPRKGLQEQLAAGIIPNLLEFSAVGDNKTDNTTAINNAIASMVQGAGASNSGGTIYVPKGVYRHEGELNLKELANVHLMGAGAQVGGGGIGGGASGNTVGASVFIYTGKGSRAWDFRSSLGCDLSNVQCFAWGSGFTGPIWDLSGTVALPSSMGHFVNARAEATAVNGEATNEILACTGALLDYANEHTFDTCVFASCENGVQGLATGGEAHSSVGHKFNSCFFSASQKLHVANPQETWTFEGCIGESLFDRKGVIQNKAGFIGYTGIGFKSVGLNLLGCWTGSNVPASRAGVCVEFRGEGLNVVGGSYNTGEIGFFFPGGCVGNSVQGVRFWKLNNSVYAEGAKTKDTVIMANRHTEIANSPPVGGTAEGKEYKGCIIQEANEAALKVS